jgi:hypothetical protein
VLLLFACAVVWVDELTVQWRRALSARAKRRLYIVYWFLAPLAPLLTYVLAFAREPHSHPDILSWTWRILLMCAFTWLWMLVAWYILVERPAGPRLEIAIAEE